MGVDSEGGESGDGKAGGGGAAVNAAIPLLQADEQRSGLQFPPESCSPDSSLFFGKGACPAGKTRTNIESTYGYVSFHLRPWTGRTL